MKGITMNNFRVLANLSPEEEEAAMAAAQQDASRNYAGISAERRKRAALENLPPEGMVIRSEPNLDVLESSPGVEQLPPEEVEKLRGVQELSEEDIRAILKAQMR